jgi:hypothetical protein
VKRTHFGVVLLLVLPLVLACGILNTAVNSVAGGSSYKPAAELWSDVPKMDGLTPSQMEDLPLPVKLLMRTILGNMGRLNSAGEDQSTGNIDWVSFDSTGTPDDIQNFYTADRMTAAGWDPSDNAPCFSGSEQGSPDVGAFCVFSKNANGLQTYLAIIATQDQSTQKTSAFFLRLEEAATPTP